MASETVQVIEQRSVDQPLPMHVVDSAAQASRPESLVELEVEEPRDGGDETAYPSGPKLWLTMVSLCITSFLSGLDLTIVAVAVPSLTNEFKTIADIGWYTAAYGMTMSAFVFFFGQLYNLFSTKSIFLAGIALFEIGSLICTFAPSSAVFILGRAITGFGRAAINGGFFRLMRFLFPLSRQALMTSIVGGIQSAGLVIAPTIGGALIDGISWRACFGINVPLGVLCFALTAYGAHDPAPSGEQVLPLKEKLKRINLLETMIVVPAITTMLMALQWGGTKYGWGSWRIILLLVLSVAMLACFSYMQYRQGDKAMLPPSILKQRSVLAGAWFAACSEGVLAVTEYYMSIYFQGVRGISATQSGILALPMVGGLSIALIVSGVGSTWLGYYHPFMLATSVLAPIASGLLTTISLHEQVAKAAALLAFLGAAVGLGISGPQIALQAVLPTKDISMGGAMLSFGGGMGSALWICASATLFQARLAEEVEASAPGTNVTTVADSGLSGLREAIGEEKLESVLSGYETAVVQTLYIPLALALLSIVGSLAMERKSIKKKQS